MKLANSHPGGQGKSIKQRMWDELDAAYDRVVASGADADKGECRGIAKCLALLENPFNPNVDMIRRLAAERHKHRAVDGQGGTQ